MMNLKTTLAALIVGLSTSAQASSPYVDCGAHDAPVLVMTAGYGLIMQGVVFRDVRLFANGDVQVKARSVERVTTPDGEDKVTSHVETYDSLWSETPEVMAKIQAAIQELRGSPLKDTTPNAPEIADGPGYGFIACQNGRQISFARMTNGHDFLPANAREAKAARYLKADLMELHKAVVSQQP